MYEDEDNYPVDEYINYMVDTFYDNYSPSQDMIETFTNRSISVEDILKDITNKKNMFRTELRINLESDSLEVDGLTEEQKRGVELSIKNKRNDIHKIFVKETSANNKLKAVKEWLAYHSLIS